MNDNHVMLICDDDYVLPTQVTIQSIIEYARKYKNERVFIHVCALELKDENAEKIKKTFSDDVASEICIFNDADLMEKVRRVEQNSYVTKSALLKFELPRFFMDIETGLYIDSDVVVVSDITQLFQMDISNYYVAGVFEIGKYVEWKKNGKKPGEKPKFYFNSGVMLMNFEKLRREHVVEAFWDYKLNKDKTNHIDQFTINEVCAGCVKKLDIKWNSRPMYIDAQYLEDINAVYEEAYASLEEYRSDIRLLHFVGKYTKPWKYKCVKMSEIWMSFYDKLQQKDELSLTDIPMNGNSLLKRVVSFGKKLFGKKIQSNIG